MNDKLTAVGVERIWELIANLKRCPTVPFYGIPYAEVVSMLEEYVRLRERSEKPVAEYMDIFAKRGTKVQYAFPQNGYAHNKEDAARLLVLGDTYTVERTVVGQSHSSVWLQEFPNEVFNTVLFAAAPSPVCAEPGCAGGKIAYEIGEPIRPCPRCQPAADAKVCEPEPYCCCGMGLDSGPRHFEHCARYKPAPKPEPGAEGVIDADDCLGMDRDELRNVIRETRIELADARRELGEAILDRNRARADEELADDRWMRDGEKRDKAEAENARLREALNAIYNLTNEDAVAQAIQASLTGESALSAKPAAEWVATFDKAVETELLRVSHVEYDSNAICKHFAAELRKRLTVEAGK